jgi:hypothetical protein
VDIDMSHAPFILILLSFAVAKKKGVANQTISYF